MIKKYVAYILAYSSFLSVIFRGVIVLTILIFLQGCFNQSEREFAYPKLLITYDDKQLNGLLGFANYTGKVNGMTGNSNFGASENEVQELVALQVKPNSIIKIKAEEVKPLNKAIYKVTRYNTIHDTGEAIPSSINNDEIMAPVEEGEYLYDVFVDWGKGDNNISYWVKIKV